jgi:DsbC/DsbD-like thiol-disulfide interchange protein
MRKRVFFCLWACFIFAFPAAAEEEAHVTAELVAQTPDSDGVFWAAVRLVAEDGWHVYWKNPGDSGLATTIVWRLPEGVVPAGKARWAAPRTFADEGIVNYGYAGETYFFLPLRASKTLGAGDRLEADVVWLACRDVCVPGKATLTLEAPFPKPRDSFAAARGRLPLLDSTGKVTARDAGESLVLRFAPGIPAPSGGVYFYAEEPSLVKHSAPQRWEASSDGHELTVPKEEPGSPAPVSVRGVVVAEGGWEGAGSPEGLEVELDTQKEAP